MIGEDLSKLIPIGLNFEVQSYVKNLYSAKRVVYCIKVSYIVKPNIFTNSITFYHTRFDLTRSSVSH
jgi:hypothetical protein